MVFPELIATGLLPGFAFPLPPLATSPETVQLVTDLGLVTLAAAIVALLFHLMRIPVFLGYVLAGLLVGSDSMPWAPLVELSSIAGLRELGVVFLMFYIGLELDLSILRRVLGPALAALCLQTAAFLFLGVQLAPLLGYTSVQGLFLGGLLAISSSMVTISVLDELGRLRMPHGQLALGILILEDVVAVALLVILSGVGISGKLEWGSVWSVSFGLGVFTVLVFFVGKVLAPYLVNLLERVARQELLTLTVIGLLLGVSILAQEMEFSIALGAFLAGSILSQTRLSQEIERSTASLRSLFVAIFFVSVGMNIEPYEIWEQAPAIAGMSVLTVGVKIGTCWLGFFIGGQRASSAFRASVVKAQIGEFSFIIAGLAISLGVAGSSLMALAVGISILSSSASILLTLRSDRIFEYIRLRLPDSLTQIFRFYASCRDSIQQRLRRNMAIRLVRRPLLQIVLNIFLISGFVSAGYFASGWIQDADWGADLQAWLIPVAWLGVALLVAPFAIAIIRNLNAALLILSEVALGPSVLQEQFRGRLRNVFNVILLVIVVTLVGGVVFAAAAPYLPRGVGLAGFLLTLALVGVLSWRKMIRLNSQVEFLFLRSFNERTRACDATARAETLREISQKYPWPVIIQEYAVHPGTRAAGATLRSLGIREHTGASVVAVSRHENLLYNPDADFQIFPGDHLFLFGEDTQIAAARRHLDQRTQQRPVAAGPARFELQQILVDSASELAGNTLAGAELRRRHGVTVLGIQRGERRMTSPGPEEMLQPGDVLYVIGNEAGIRYLQESSGNGDAPEADEAPVGAGSSSG